MYEALLFALALLGGRLMAEPGPPVRVARRALTIDGRTVIEIFRRVTR